MAMTSSCRGLNVVCGWWGAWHERRVSPQEQQHAAANLVEGADERVERHDGAGDVAERRVNNRGIRAGGEGEGGGATHSGV
jgi:hypothetical protein